MNHNPGFDWNGNNQTDSFDSFMDMEVIDDETSSSGYFSPRKNQKNSKGKTLYDSTKDTTEITLFKCIIVLGLCLGAFALSFLIEGGLFAGILSLAAVWLSIKVLKNT